MRVGSRGRISCKARGVLGWIFATLLVAVAVFGPPLTGPSAHPMVELRHNVLMIDREFERWSIRTNPSSGPIGTLNSDDPARPSSTRVPSKPWVRGATT
jgi:hypothetical protein